MFGLEAMKKCMSEVQKSMVCTCIYMQTTSTLYVSAGRQMKAYTCNSVSECEVKGGYISKQQVHRICQLDNTCKGKRV